jgi:hypothetical protein
MNFIKLHLCEFIQSLSLYFQCKSVDVALAKRKYVP